MSVGLVTGLTAEAHLARRFGPVLAGGGTPHGARLAAQSLVNRGAEALISFGLAGALDPALRAGDLVIPRAVLSGGRRYLTDPSLVGPATADLVLGGDRILSTQAEKLAAWTATDCIAVDLESGAVAEAAAAAKIPFAVFRAICDPAERSLPPAALLALDQLGRIGFIKVAASVIASPGQLPALLSLARDAHAARRTLVNNRFRLLFLSNAAISA